MSYGEQTEPANEAIDVLASYHTITGRELQLAVFDDSTHRILFDGMPLCIWDEKDAETARRVFLSLSKSASDTTLHPFGDGKHKPGQLPHS